MQIFEKSKNLCEEIFNDFPDSSITARALNVYWQADQKQSELGGRGQTDFIKLLNALVAKSQRSDLSAYANLLLASFEGNPGIDRLDNLILEFKKSEFVEMAIFQKFMYYLYEKDDAATAANILVNLRTNSPASNFTTRANELFESFEGDKYEKERNNCIVENNVLNTPESYELWQNYPNPFNSNTHIKFSLPSGDRVKIIIYDINGRIVKNLVDQYYDKGHYNVSFDGFNLASGIYFYKFQTSKYTTVKRMLLMK